MKAGFVGLGRMGAAMVGHLVAAGVDVVAHDRDPARVAASGARPARDLAEVAAAGDVLLSLPGPPEVEAVGAGLISLMAPGATLVILSTVGPSTVVMLADTAAPAGIAVVDAPVTGAADGARAGTLTVMAGAAPEDLERVRPLLEPISSTIDLLGPVGAGSAAKLLTNMLWFVQVIALADALALGERAGVPREALAALIPKSAGTSWAAEHDLPNILRGDDDDSFTLALCTKDLRLMAELAEEHGFPAPMAALARARFEAAAERYGLTAGELAVTRLAGEDL
jgi:3-hydroxyisobutyrate dehydrogenase-like beta-hydroxyacid dehydrogenase